MKRAVSILILSALLLLSACGKQKSAEGEEPAPAAEKGVVYETVILKPVPAETSSPTETPAPTVPPATEAPAEPTPTESPATGAYETELLQ